MFELAPGEPLGVQVAHLFDLQGSLERHRITGAPTNNVQVLLAGDARAERS